MFRPIAATFRLLQFCSKSIKEYHIYAYIARWYSLSKTVITWRWPLLAETCSYFSDHHKSILPQLCFHDWYLPHHKWHLVGFLFFSYHNDAWSNTQQKNCSLYRLQLSRYIHTVAPEKENRSRDHLILSVMRILLWQV